MENYDSLRILFIRHAQTNYDDWEGRDPSDGELTPFGEEQCNILGEKLKNEKLSIITPSVKAVFFNSDSARVPLKPPLKTEGNSIMSKDTFLKIIAQ